MAGIPILPTPSPFRSPLPGWPAKTAITQTVHQIAITINGDISSVLTSVWLDADPFLLAAVAYRVAVVLMARRAAEDRAKERAERRSQGGYYIGPFGVD